METYNGNMPGLQEWTTKGGRGSKVQGLGAWVAKIMVQDELKPRKNVE